MFNIAILGFGTVGSGVYEVIKENNALLKQKTGEDLAVKKILDIREFAGSEWESLVVHDIKEIIEDDDIDVVVETMGGTSPAFEFVRDALISGKHVTTSNKALVAAHGTELLKIAREKNVNFFFEASVGGGIPIIRTITESYAGEHFKEITGILNGTTNYILTMDVEGEDFEKALSTAQELGYAERNPEADVEGYDTCRKIAILASLATGKEVNFEEIHTEGITKIDTTDFEYAKHMKLSIKLFGDSKFEDGKVFAFVAPVMVERDHPLYMVNDVFNGIMVEGNMLGKSMLYGSGAGKLPTASAVVADIVAITKNKDKNVATFGWGDEKQEVADMNETSHKYFVRFKGRDAEFINKCKETFKNAKEVYLDGKDEFALVTELMKEKDFLTALNNLGDVIKYIRTKIA